MKQNSPSQSAKFQMHGWRRCKMMLCDICTEAALAPTSSSARSLGSISPKNRLPRRHHQFFIPYQESLRQYASDTAFFFAPDNAQMDAIFTLHPGIFSNRNSDTGICIGHLWLDMRVNQMHIRHLRAAALCMGSFDCMHNECTSKHANRLLPRFYSTEIWGRCLCAVSCPYAELAAHVKAEITLEDHRAWRIDSAQAHRKAGI